MIPRGCIIDVPVVSFTEAENIYVFIAEIITSILSLSKWHDRYIYDASTWDHYKIAYT
jgi:hypothetical protein